MARMTSTEPDKAQAGGGRGYVYVMLHGREGAGFGIACLVIRYKYMSH